MVRSKTRVILFFVTLLILLTFLTSGCLLLRYLPDNEVGVVLFKFVYRLPLNRKYFLEFYSPVRKNSIGYVPVKVNQFLIQKLEDTNDDQEISAIVNFYALQASEHRLGYLINISEQAKIKIISQTIKELDEEENLGGKLMMLDEIRTGNRLGKGGYGIEGVSYPKFTSPEEYRKWFYEKSAPTVISKYQEWWNSNLSWGDKKKINPLEGTNIKVSQCCG